MIKTLVKYMKLCNRYTVGLRDSVQTFATLMEFKLRENDHKGGWRNAKISYLLRRLNDERKELHKAINSNADKDTVVMEAADVANFAMMVADVYEQEIKP